LYLRIYSLYYVARTMDVDISMLKQFLPNLNNRRRSEFETFCMNTSRFFDFLFIASMAHHGLFSVMTLWLFQCAAVYRSYCRLTSAPPRVIPFLLSDGHWKVMHQGNCFFALGYTISTG